MNRWFIRSVALVCGAAALAAAYSVSAAELKVLATGAHIDSFKEIVPQFERASGHKLIVKYDATPVAIKNIEAGEAFDVAVIINGPMNEAAKKGFFAEGERPKCLGPSQKGRRNSRCTSATGCGRPASTMSVRYLPNSTKDLCSRPLSEPKRRSRRRPMISSSI